LEKVFGTAVPKKEGRMRPGSVSRTALGTAAGRAVESCHSKNDRLFEDPFAREFLPFSYWAIVSLLCLPGIGAALLSMRERQLPGIMGNLLCRTRFIDDVLGDAIRRGFDQLVILGAGLDSRAYRIPGIEKIHVIEVDHPITQEWKKGRLKRIFGVFPSHVTFVPIDFDRQELSVAMQQADFRADARTFFIWEGVTQYITLVAADATLRFISSSAGPENEIVFTYIDGRIIDGSLRSEGSDSLIANLRRHGEPWIFGIAPAGLDAYLAARGFELVEEAGASEYRERYLKPLGRRMNIFEGERVVLARVKH
jgi:methyltransferase (TIGR00027 family)